MKIPSRKRKKITAESSMLTADNSKMKARVSSYRKPRPC